MNLAISGYLISFVALYFNSNDLFGKNPSNSNTQLGTYTPLMFKILEIYHLFWQLTKIWSNTSHFFAIKTILLTFLLVWYPNTFSEKYWTPCYSFPFPDLLILRRCSTTSKFHKQPCIPRMKLWVTCNWAMGPPVTLDTNNGSQLFKTQTQNVWSGTESLQTMSRNAETP